MGHATLSPIIMEVENGCIWNYWRGPFSTSMSNGRKGSEIWWAHQMNASQSVVLWGQLQNRTPWSKDVRCRVVESKVCYSSLCFRKSNGNDWDWLVVQVGGKWRSTMTGNFIFLGGWFYIFFFTTCRSSKPKKITNRNWPICQGFWHGFYVACLDYTGDKSYNV